MRLMTKAIESQLPALYTNDGKGLDAIAVVKFFTPDSNWTWYATEGSAVDANGFMDTDRPKVDFLFFGLVDGEDQELGYFSLNELTQIRGSLGLPVERDLHWKPKTLREIQNAINGLNDEIPFNDFSDPDDTTPDTPIYYD